MNSKCSYRASWNTRKLFVWWLVKKWYSKFKVLETSLQLSIHLFVFSCWKILHVHASKIRIEVIGGGSRVFLGHFSVLKYVKVLIKQNQLLFTACEYLFVLSSSGRSKFRKYGGFYGNSRFQSHFLENHFFRNNFSPNSYFFLKIASDLHNNEF